VKPEKHPHIFILSREILKARYFDFNGTVEVGMQTGLLVAGYIVVGTWFLWQILKVAIKRGGRQVKWVNPQDFVIFLEEQKQNMFDRFIPLDGTVNFRDIGGYLTESGHRVLSGKVFRSDELGDLSDGDISTLKEMGLRFIFDLRNKREVRKKTDRIPPDAPFKYVHAPIYEKEPKGEYLPAILFNRHRLGIFWRRVIFS